MDGFIHQLLSGVANGAIYATIALAVVMIYHTTHHVNFAQGEMAMLSTYLAWSLITAGVPYWLAFFVTIGLSFVAGALIERVLIRPVEDAPMMAVVVVFIGLLVIMNSLAGWLFTYNIKKFPSPFAEDAWFATRFMSAHEVGAVFVMLCVLGVVFVFFRYTALGLAMRGAAENAASSRLLGISVGRMLALGWGLAGALGAVAGMMAAPSVYLDPNMMSGILLYGVASALLGGIENPWGAALGGFIVGVVDNLCSAYVTGTDLKLTVALTIIVAVLVIRPNGLFGRTVVTRV